MAGLVVLVGVGPAGAQPAERVLAGRVADAETGAPLAAAHVFLAHSTRGTTTADDGTFRLGAVPAGAHEVAVSMLGYALHVYDLAADAPDSLFLDVRLHPAVLPLGAIEVAAERPPSWHASLDLFLRLFLGETENAARCTLHNPEVLVFEGDPAAGHLRAEATAPLLVENQALGYLISFHLVEFATDGETVRYRGLPHYADLEPRNRREERRWRRRRRDAYEGSPQHFFATVITAGDLRAAERAGFDVRVAPRFDYDAAETIPARPDAVSIRPEGAHRRLALQHPLQVVFKPDLGPALSATTPGGGSVVPDPTEYTSWIRLNEASAAVLPSGHFSDPYAVTLYGRWGRERLADDLPRDYVPDS